MTTKCSVSHWCDNWRSSTELGVRQRWKCGAGFWGNSKLSAKGSYVIMAIIFKFFVILLQGIWCDIIIIIIIRKPLKRLQSVSKGMLDYCIIIIIILFIICMISDKWRLGFQPTPAKSPSIRKLTEISSLPFRVLTVLI